MSSIDGTGTGNNGRNGTTLIQPSPPGTALDQHQQQQLMLGQGGGQSPPMVGAQGFGPSPAAPRATARGLVAALQDLVNKETPGSVAADFNKQRSIYNAYAGSKATQFMEETAFSSELMVLAYLPSSSVGFIKLGWGISTYKNNDPNNDVPDGTIAFIGDIDGNGNIPPAVTLPPTNAVQWVKVKAPISRDDYEREYVEGGDSRELRVLPNGRENNHIPRMLYAPPRVALFLATQPRRHHELYYELKRLVADNASGVEPSHVQLMLDWCVVASFQYNKTTGKQFSLLKLDMTTILSDFPDFVGWKQQQVNAWLGSPSAASTTAAHAGAAQPGTAQSTISTPSQLSDMQVLATMMKDQQKSAMEMTERMLQNQKEMFMAAQRNQGGSSTAALNFANLKAMQGAELFALMYYCSVNDPDKIPPIWTVLYSNESLLEKRQQLRAGVIAWSVSKANRVVNKIIHFEEHFFDNCKKMNLGCNEIKASYLMLDRGMSPQSCLQVTLQYIQEQIMLESAAAAASGNLTLTETKSLSTKEARKPPTDPKELRASIHTFCGLISTMLGEDNDLYSKWEMFGDTMEDEAVHAQEAAYSKLIILQYWSYAIDTTRRYFYDPATRREFNQLGGPRFPKCIMDGSFWTAILNAQPWPTASFPSPWTKYVNGGVATNTTNNNSNSGGGRNSNSNNNNNNNNRNSNNNSNNRNNNSNSSGGWSSSDWKSKLHPIQLEVWGEYHNKVGGRVYLDEMCTECGITIGQLPFLNRYMVQRGEQRENKLCYKSIIGDCSWPGCIFDHPTKQELDGSEEKRFLNKLNKVLKAGRDKIVQDGPPPRRHTGKRGRYR